MLPNSQTHHHKPQKEPNKPINTTGIERQQQHYTYTTHYLFSSCSFCFSLLFSCFFRLFFLVVLVFFRLFFLFCSHVLSLILSVCSHVCFFLSVCSLVRSLSFFCSFICSFPCSSLFVFPFFSHTFSYLGISGSCAFSLPFTPLA